MATRRSSNVDNAATTGGTPDELISRIASLEQVFVAKLDTVVAELRAEFSNTVKVLESSFDDLKTENTGLRDELKLVKTQVENNTTKMAKLEIKLQEVQGHSIANEQYSMKKKMCVYLDCTKMRARTV